MKIQLTKTKSIEIGKPSSAASGGAKKTSGLSDVVGVELFSGDARGCPAVRLTCKKGVWGVAAAGFVPPPDGALPEKWEETSMQPTWAFPFEFQAPHAALAVSTPDMFVRQSSAASATAGVPESKEGTRSVSLPMADGASSLECGIPEFQALWLSRLLPEGKRPTASSIQLAPAAMLSSVRLQPEFAAADGTVFAVFVLQGSVFFAGYKEGGLVLFRQCPGTGGWLSMRETVKTKLGLEDEIVDSVLDDTLIDPRPALEPFVRPVLNQLELSLDYLSSRHSLKITKVFLMGLPSGAHYWSQISADVLRLPLVTPSVFEGLQTPQVKVAGGKGAKPAEITASQSQVFLTAFGAARAAMEA